MTLSRVDKVFLVGRTGSGKSTLLKVLAGLIPLDGGERFVQPGTRIAYLDQDPTIHGETVIAYAGADLAPEAQHRAEALLDALGLDPNRVTEGLSGGERRRAALTRALAVQPDVLLLDEPTNHLDLPAIRWLERQVETFRGALMTISHDRAFLRAVSRQTVWLDRGKAQRNGAGFSDFESWSETVLEQEAHDLHTLDKTLEAEARWLARGVTARRKRNQGRLRRLMDLRQERAAYAGPQGAAKLAAEVGRDGGRLVVEAKDIAKGFAGVPVLADFSTRILRGDRIGIVGPNGAGKSTLVKLLTGGLVPDRGTVKLGTNLDIAYFDQHRAQLDMDSTPWDVLTGGSGDQVEVRGVKRHVMGYLKDFLFEERQARTPISKLSGGERNRLLLAALLAKPANVLILDEPTNDLDMDTLDVLEEMLADFAGTLILVSHDRDFLDRLVTSTMVLEGDGRVEEYVGGYSDYLRQRAQAAPAVLSDKPATAASSAKPKAQTKLSYKDQRELDGLPACMDALRQEIAKLEKTLSDPSLFSANPSAYQTATARHGAAQSELAQAEERWLELELRQEELR